MVTVAAVSGQAALSFARDQGNCSPGGMLTLRWPPVQPPAIPSEAFPILLDTVMGASILTVG